MKSYSNEVADNGKVEAVEQRLTEALSKQDEAQNGRIANLEGKVKYLTIRSYIASGMIFLIVLTDILRHGW